MRALQKISAVSILPLFLTSCVLSIDSVVPDSDTTFDQRLLGTWEEVGGSDRAVVSHSKNSEYSIEYTDGHGAPVKLQARLGHLEDRLVLDLRPALGDSNLPQPYIDLLVPGHLLLTIEITGNELRMAALNADSLRAALGGGQLGLTHTISGDRLILHDATVQLRSILGGYVVRPGALESPNIWRRAQGPVAITQSPPPSVEVPCFEASAWREADGIFHRDPHWVGADGASSVDLGAGRTLWLFGDTWIDKSGRGTRQGATIVSNSVAIQAGSDPASSTIAFYWGKTDHGDPAAFVPDRGAERLWLGNGVRAENRLVLFFERIRNTNMGLGFESLGWTAVLVENPDSEPSAWQVRPLETPTNPLGILVGYAAVLRLGEYVYALGSQDPVKSHPIYAARWPAEEVRRGSLLHPEWWAGGGIGWVPDSSNAPRWPLFENGQADLTIHVDPATQRFLGVQTAGFGPADIMMRAAPTLTGPWSTLRMVYRPPEYYRPNVMIYSGKAHPQLTGADLVLTYATNTFQFAENLTDSLIYYPRFVRLSRCK